MTTSNSKKEEYITSIIHNIPKEQFKITKILGNNYFNGIAIVKNNKLAGRVENIKFLESVEPNLRKQFLNECKILSAMQHKNIPQIYDIIEYNDILLFRSEHIEGYSLKEVLEYLENKQEEFPPYVATSIILKLMNALYYAHNEVYYENKKRSIIHCDIKPSNIMLRAKNYKRKNKIDATFIKLLKENKVEPFLVDFGIAKFKGDINLNGTSTYMSPTQITKHKIDWRTDTHQLLLVYYEMLTKKKPYSNIQKNKLVEEKLKHDFKIDKSIIIKKSIKDFIEKGTQINSIDSFKSEKECIKDLVKIEIHQNNIENIRKYKKPASIIIMSVIFVALVLFLYHTWDYNTQSIDAIIKNIEKNPSPNKEELESVITRIQIRAFEKKYYAPLIKGEFRDTQTNTPLYPSHLDTHGKWVLTGPETESAGIFTGLLFEYSDRYPKLLTYAKEYAEPILKSEFDGASEKRYMYALIPGYEKTHDDRYLQKLINVSDTLIYHFSSESGSTQCNDMYQEKLFLYVYNKTGNKRYLEFYNILVKTFIKNNIDSDGYIYAFVDTEILPDGAIKHDKWGRLITPVGTYPIGSYFENNDNNNYQFKNVSAPLSRDVIETIITLKDMYNIIRAVLRTA